MNCSIIISSFDSYEDAWHPFFTLFFKYWPDCPFPVYLITINKEYSDARVKSLKLGQDKGWSSNLKEALKKIDTDYVMYLQEDYFLMSKVDTEKILKLIEYIKSNNIAYLRIFPSPKPDISFENDLGLGEISKDAPYRNSTQAAIWNKDILNGILIEGETGWDFEGKGRERSKNIDFKFLSVKKPALDYFAETAIKKGRWYFDAVRLCQREGILLDISRRPVESRSEYFKRKLFRPVRKFFQDIAAR